MCTGQWLSCAPPCCLTCFTLGSPAQPECMHYHIGHSIWHGRCGLCLRIRILAPNEASIFALSPVAGQWCTQSRSHGGVSSVATSSLAECSTTSGAAAWAHATHLRCRGPHHVTGLLCMCAAQLNATNATAPSNQTFTLAQAPPVTTEAETAPGPAPTGDTFLDGGAADFGAAPGFGPRAAAAVVATAAAVAMMMML